MSKSKIMSFDDLYYRYKTDELGYSWLSFANWFLANTGKHIDSVDARKLKYEVSRIDGGEVSDDRWCSLHESEFQFSIVPENPSRFTIVSDEDKMMQRKVMDEAFALAKEYDRLFKEYDSLSKDIDEYRVSIKNNLLERLKRNMDAIESKTERQEKLFREMGEKLAKCMTLASLTPEESELFVRVCEKEEE